MQTAGRGLRVHRRGRAGVESRGETGAVVALWWWASGCHNVCGHVCIWRAALVVHAAELPRSGARARSAPRGARPLARAAETSPSGYSGLGVIF